MSKTKKRKYSYTQIAFRITSAQREAVDRELRLRKQESPGLNLTRADLARLGLFRLLKERGHIEISRDAEVSKEKKKAGEKRGES